MDRERLRQRIIKVRDYSVSDFSEDKVKQYIIAPIFNDLGWDTSDPHEVKTEYALPPEGRVDYAFFGNSGPLIFVEAKAPNIHLEDYTSQLLKYAFAKDVKLAVLTNGLEWWLYLPMEGGDWDDRKFFSVDLAKQDVETICDMLTCFLVKKNVVSGEALSEAKKMRKSTERDAKIRNALPKVWKAIVAQPHQQLIDLLTDETERNCGYKPDESTVRTFIEKLTYTGAPEKSDKEKEGRSPKFTGTEGGGKTRISRIGRKSMDDRTLELVKDNPHRYSEEEISQIICEEYADDKHTPDTLRDTTHRRLHGHLNRTKGVRIEKDASGKYFVVE